MCEKYKVKHYKYLISLSYAEVVKYLNSIYGKVNVDYFHKKSFENYINSNKMNPKSPRKAKDKKSKLGLYRHHVREFEEENLNLLKNKPLEKLKFEDQRKENLVYCDLIEHFILHQLIVRETDKKHSQKGSQALRGKVKKWYIDEHKPNNNEISFYYKAKLSSSEAQELLNYIDSKV